ncbi:hypothetical protein XENOCAPTIV_024915 [Xenoophorus captivus]|uniref:Uncharacterized protein n=1 Tax=Xenoophorus captivus TaxID=1517983 RepID=A0ABV0RM19_9TELE
MQNSSATLHAPHAFSILHNLNGNKFYHEWTKINWKTSPFFTPNTTLTQAQIQNQVMFAGRKSLEPHNRNTVPQHHLHLPSSHPPNDREQIQMKGAGGETCMDTAITELLTKGYFLVYKSRNTATRNMPLQ